MVRRKVRLMTKKERVLHSVLFEVLALLLLIPLGSMVGNLEAHAMTGVAILMSLLAMGWNYLYNMLFDKLFSTDRSNRTPALRVLHGVMFELGLMLVTMPILMWVLQRDFWEVLTLEIGIILLFMIYAVVYNWLYDIVRARVMRLGLA